MTDFNKKKLLLHTCCAPCSVYIAPELSKKYNVTCFFYNPNIDDPEEYRKRAVEMKNMTNTKNISLIMGEYEVKQWKNRVTGMEDKPEGGARCHECFKIRMKKTAEIAAENGFDLFATTLTVAPMKNANVINAIGKKASTGAGVEYMESDFKKKDGYRKSVVMSKEMGLYRQNYCGCSYSKRQPKL